MGDILTNIPCGKQELAVEHQITMLPAFSIFVDGQRLEHFVGLNSCYVLSRHLHEIQACNKAEDQEGESWSFTPTLASHDILSVRVSMFVRFWNRNNHSKPLRHSNVQAKGRAGALLTP